MTFDQIWSQLTRKKPALERDDTVVEFTAGNLRRLLMQAYEQGEASVPREKKSRSGLPFPFSEFGG